MKIFKLHGYALGLFICLASNAIVARQHEPSQMLLAYHNKILNISYVMDSDHKHSIQFSFEYDPICMYTPLSYKESLDSSLTKTYFLPRTKSTDLQISNFYEDLHESLQLLGIDVQITKIENKNYGLQISFTMQSDNFYDIVKIVDHDKKTVCFDIVAKI